MVRKRKFVKEQGKEDRGIQQGVTTLIRVLQLILSGPILPQQLLLPENPPLLLI